MEEKDKRSDEELVTAFQQGDTKAFETLYKRYYPKVYRRAWGIVHNHHDAEDISQNVFLAVYGALPRFHPMKKNAFEHWINLIAYHAALNFIKKRDKLISVPLYETDEEGEEYPIEIPDTGPTPEEIAEGGEVYDEILKAIESLPPKQRQVVKLRLLNEWSLEEIAERIERKLGTVKAHLYSGLEKLRKILSESGFKPEKGGI